MKARNGPDPLTGLSSEQVLAELEDVIRAMLDPQKFHFQDAATLAWLGRASAAMENWSMPHMVQWDSSLSGLRRPGTASQQNEYRLVTLLHQAQNDVRLKTVGPASVAIGQGGVHDYFDELRKIIELAVTDMLFVDPYMDADFVGRYLPHIKSSASVRLLGRNKIVALASAAQIFAQQHSLKIEVRSSNDLHDRHVIIDGQRCFTSGASFKDGAKRTGTTITETVDAAAALRNTYEELWSKGMVA